MVNIRGADYISPNVICTTWTPVALACLQERCAEHGHGLGFGASGGFGNQGLWKLRGLGSLGA